MLESNSLFHWRNVFFISELKKQGVSNTLPLYVSTDEHQRLVVHYDIEGSKTDYTLSDNIEDSVKLFLFLNDHGKLPVQPKPLAPSRTKPKKLSKAEEYRRAKDGW